MDTYAIVTNNVVGELFQPPDGFTIAQCFPEGFVCVDIAGISPQPQVGWTATQNNGAWQFSAPAPQPVPVPQQVSIFQCKAWLLSQPGHSGTLLDDVTAWVATQSAMFQLAWNEATVVMRTGQFVEAAMAHFGWSGAVMDAAFTAASQIQV